MTYLPRETGAAKAGRSCPTCGTDMQVSDTAYGSVTATCPKCSAAPEREQASVQDPPRELGTVTNEETA